MEITTFPASSSRSGLRVLMALSQGVASTTTSAPAAPGIVCAPDIEVQVRPLRRHLVGYPHRPFRLPRAQGHLNPGRGQADRQSSPRRARTTKYSDVHAPLSHNLVVPMGLLDGKRLLITGVLTDASLAFGVAKLAQKEGAEIVLSGAGRALSLTKRTARKLPTEPDVLEIDVTSPEQLARAGAALAARWDRLDGILHAIGFAPPNCLGSGMFAANWDEVSVALNVSAYSLKALIEAFKPLLIKAGRHSGASVVGLDFDATVAWPIYDWMGVAKAALESLTRYLARDLGPDGIRVNLVAAGPIRTMAAKSIPGFSELEETLERPGPPRLGRQRL